MTDADRYAEAIAADLVAPITEHLLDLAEVTR